LLKKLKRRQFIKLGLLAGGGAAVYSYGRFFGAKALEVVRTSIPIPRSRLSQKIRVLHLSDFHVSSVVPLQFVKKAIEIGMTQNPDAVCLTGDFVTAGSRHKLTPYKKMLKSSLGGKIPAFACLGNHDGGRWSGRLGGYRDTSDVNKFLLDSGVVVLNNEEREVQIGEQSVSLVGLEDLWSGNVDVETAFNSAPKAETIRIVLAHNPDTKRLMANHQWDLMLSGHTHGGQVILPFIGAPFAPIRDRRFVMGLNYWGKRAVYTTRGVGNLFGFRLNCPPEISVLDLVPNV